MLLVTIRIKDDAGYGMSISACVVAMKAMMNYGSFSQTQSEACRKIDRINAAALRGESRFAHVSVVTEDRRKLCPFVSLCTINLMQTTAFFLSSSAQWLQPGRLSLVQHQTPVGLMLMSG